MLRHRSKLSVAVFLLPPLLVYAAAVLLPILQSLYLSLFSWDGLTPKQFVGFHNYVQMLSRDDLFWPAVGHSIVYLAVNLVFQLGVALFLANLLTYLSKGSELVKTLFLLPTVLSTVAIAILFRRVYSVEPVGLLNQALHAVGLGGLAQPWLSDHSTALVAVSIPEGWRFTGLYMIILYAAIRSVPREIEEAAHLDGTSEWRLFWSIRFPHIRPVWITTTIMALTYSLRGFDIPYLLTNGGPGQSTELLTTYMYKVAFTSSDYGMASTIAVFVVLECVVGVLAVLLLVRRKGLTSS
jgi:raffinose/stachyose/melibiose transport system permease protein